MMNANMRRCVDGVCSGGLPLRRGEPRGEAVDGFGHEADDEEIVQLRERLRRSRIDLGPHEADARWVAGPFREWMRLLGAGEEDGRRVALTRGHALALAAGMMQSLTIRDALVISLVARPGRCGREEMIALVRDPFCDDSRHLVCGLLSDAFDDTTLHPDVRRCRAGLSMLVDMAGMVPVCYRAQPLSIIAYLLWWLGCREALAVALECLTIDEDCTLAEIIVSALAHGVAPAWMEDVAVELDDDSCVCEVGY